MKYLLDTNICIHFFRGRFDLNQKLQEVDLDNCAISEISLSELVFGAENSGNPDKNLRIISQFTDQVKVLPIYNAIGVYAKEKVRLRKSGYMISDFDLLIAATSIANELIMVTENLREFDRVSGINTENWIKR